MYFEEDAITSELKRMYIRLKSSLAFTSKSEGWDEAKEHAEVFRFCSVITKTHSIYPYATTSNFIGKEILLRYTTERNGLKEPITLETIDPRIREWFVLKTLPLDSQIEAFAKIGGSLIKVALLLPYSLPRRPSWLK